MSVSPLGIINAIFGEANAGQAGALTCPKDAFTKNSQLKPGRPLNKASSKGGVLGASSPSILSPPPALLPMSLPDGVLGAITTGAASAHSQTGLGRHRHRRCFRCHSQAGSWPSPPPALLPLSLPGGVLGATTTGAASAVTPRRGLGRHRHRRCFRCHSQAESWASPPPALLPLSLPSGVLGATATTTGAASAVTPRRGLGCFLPMDTATTAGAASAVTPRRSLGRFLPIDTEIIAKTAYACHSQAGSWAPPPPALLPLSIPGGVLGAITTALLPRHSQAGSWAPPPPALLLLSLPGGVLCTSSPWTHCHHRRCCFRCHSQAGSWAPPPPALLLLSLPGGVLGATTTSAASAVTPGWGSWALLPRGH